MTGRRSAPFPSAVRRAFGSAGVLPLAVIALVVVMSFVDARFLGAQNVTNILRTASFLAIVACGQALVLIVGGFDLSVGAIVALASQVGAIVMRAYGVWYPEQAVLAILAGVGAGLAVGVAVGIVNGICVAVFRIPGFIATLGTMSITLGIAYMLTNGIPVYGLPQSFITEIGRGRWLGIPVGVFVAAAVIALLVVVQRHTVFGRYLYAVGGSRHAALVSGVAAIRYQMAAYVLSGFLAAATGLLLTALVGSGQATLGGDILMLQSIAAAVIGGVSLQGGVGRLEMVALSALFLTLLSNAMNLLRVDSRTQPILIGAILICAVTIDEVRRRNKPHAQ